MASFFYDAAKIAQRQRAFPPSVFHDTFSTRSSLFNTIGADTVQTSALRNVIFWFKLAPPLTKC